ncbi:conserved hypothetical protein [Leishmania infantum JPCM5]|uniref:Uncharacterized protein n=2 Tax=Leishmania infantum TaxID=5671 RepID=A4IAZ6_LEIIN|nr:conserved hypothetical protein [Leishmania infantum JPCM5]CAC9543416.1 hypothetical_protein_-_conserved [Leishmania infantum]CAM72008.1 conserved hypothetical protein [Leishmania infantum JPCM5]SUZ45926.1 hypothetical_protein_-_conserved [Leishmania infantum]|eukprot:XP_001468915.1 conserved hypothetical protein [Leishmania infantum JPCM5]
MLHKYDKIEDAMAACVSLEYPLIVALHDKLPSFLNNADEATRGSGASGVAGGRSAAGLTFSFLPTSRSMAMIQSNSSFFADGSDSCEASHTAPDLAAAVANSSLGYLMRPANLTAAAAANASLMAQALADGEELALVPDFPLGSVQGGAAQREALLVTFLESRLGSVMLLHLIEAETPDYAAFSTAVPAAPGIPGTALPRVHIFFPPSAGMAPVVLSGSSLTPQSVYNCVQMGLLKLKVHTSPATASGSTDELLSFFSTTVAAMNREYARARQRANSASPISDSSTAPLLQQRHSDPAATTGTAADGEKPTTTAPIVAVPAQRAKGTSSSDALEAAHLIRVAGLPMSFTTSATARAAHKTILTTSSMTLQTVWRVVEKHLEWAQREVQQAQAASTWNGVTPPKPGAKFTFTIESSATPAEAAAVTVTTREEAARVRLQDYPRNTVFQVHFDGVAPPSPQPAVPAPAAATTSALRPNRYMCEGDVCRWRVPEDTPAPAAAAAAAAPPAPKAESALSPASVRLRCSLPNGKTLDLAQLDPSVATLRDDVRPAVADALGYDNFVFVCAYPPRRYSIETDEPLPLKDVELGRSSALRVVSLDGPTSPDASSRGSQPQQQPGHTRQMLVNAASSLMAMLAGALGNQGGAPAAAAAPASPGTRQSQQQRRTFNSMAEMLAANEEAERQTAMERLRQEQEQQGLGPSSSSRHQPDAEQRAQGKKSNRYFGGGSTEFIAEDGHDEAGKDSDGKRVAMEGLTPEQQEAFLSEQLRQLMNRHRRQSGEAGNENEEDAEEEDEGRAQRRVEGYGAFQGQGRRLAGDAPPASGDSSNAASPHPLLPSD